jgi:hypothetical protein
MGRIFKRQFELQAFNPEPKDYTSNPILAQKPLLFGSVANSEASEGTPRVPWFDVQESALDHLDLSHLETGQVWQVGGQNESSKIVC